MGVLKVNVGGTWVPVGFAPGNDEVAVQANDPGTDYELWYDTDDPGVFPRPATVSQNVAISAQNIPNSLTLLATLDFGVATYSREYSFHGCLIGQAVTAAALLRLGANINGSTWRQIQWGVPLSASESCFIIDQAIIAPGPGVFRFYAQNYAVGTYNVIADSTFSQLSVICRAV